jgi:hypothetical protein
MLNYLSKDIIFQIFYLFKDSPTNAFHLSLTCKSLNSFFSKSNEKLRKLYSKIVYSNDKTIETLPVDYNFMNDYIHVYKKLPCGKIHGLYTVWFNFSDIIVHVCETRYYRDGIPTGEWLIYDPKRLKVRMPIVNGLIDVTIEILQPKIKNIIYWDSDGQRIN